MMRNLRCCGWPHEIQTDADNGALESGVRSRVVLWAPGLLGSSHVGSHVKSPLAIGTRASSSLDIHHCECLAFAMVHICIGFQLSPVLATPSATYYRCQFSSRPAFAPPKLPCAPRAGCLDWNIERRCWAADIQSRRQSSAELMFDSASLKFPQEFGIVYTEQVNAHASARVHSERH